MIKEKIIKEVEKKLDFSNKRVLNETVCMPEWPNLPKRKIEKNSSK